MGTKLVEQAWRVGDLRPTEKYVLVALAYVAVDTTGMAWMSAAEIADLTSFSSRQIFRILKSLKEKNYISNVTGVYSKSLWNLNALKEKTPLVEHQ